MVAVLGILAAIVAMLWIGVARAAAAPEYIGLDWSTSLLAENSEEMANLHNEGANAFRIQLNDEGGTPNWTGLDKVFGNAADNGIRVIPMLFGYHKSQRYPLPGEYAEWNTWVGEVVSRYGVGGSFWTGRAHVLPATAWEVWNEENKSENTPIGGTPASYGQFLSDTAGVIRAHGGLGTKVLFGGIWGPKVGATPPNGETFIKEATAGAGGPSAYDGVSLHPYGWGTTNSARLASMTSEITEAENALKALGVGTKPLWITELGWPVELGPAEYKVTETQQAELLTSSFTTLKAKSNVQALIWYNGRDTPATTWAGVCGLREYLAGGYVRPSLFAFEAQAGVAPWSPTGWYSDQQSGELTSSPDMASWNEGRFDVVGRGTDGRLWHRYFQEGQGWSAWERVEVGPAINSGPGVTSWAQGRLDVVAAAPNGSVQHWWWEGGAWYTDNLGGEIASGSSPDISSGQYGRLDVYIKGVDNALWHKWYYPTVGWSVWERIGGNLASGPAAVSSEPGRYDVVARDPNNTIEHWWWNGSGWASENLGGEMSSEPDLASTGGSSLAVFSSSINPSLGTWTIRRANGGGWGGWEHFGAPISYGPGAVAWGPHRIDVLGVNGGSLRHYWWQG